MGHGCFLLCNINQGNHTLSDDRTANLRHRETGNNLAMLPASIKLAQRLRLIVRLPDAGVVLLQGVPVLEPPADALCSPHASAIATLLQCLSTPRNAGGVTLSISLGVNPTFLSAGAISTPDTGRVKENC